MKLRLLITLLFVLLLQKSVAQNYILDSSFGNGGKVINTQNINSDDFFISSKLQIDGKILVSVLKDFSTNGNTSIIRYNADGSLDTSFGNNGIVDTDLVIEVGYSSSMKIQNDGKILLTGSKPSSSSPGLNFYNFAVKRYNSDGTIDLTFGTNGTAMIDFNASPDLSHIIDIQSDNKIIVAGETHIDQDHTVNVAVTRLLPTGEIDTTFGNNGKTIISMFDDFPTNYVKDIKILPDNSIILLVDIYFYDVFNGFIDYSNFGLTKLNQNGLIDTTFGENGYVITNLGYNQNVPYSFDISGENIFVCGYTIAPTGIKMALANYNINGNLNASFGDNGKIVLNRDVNSNFDLLLFIKVQNDGKLLCAGVSNNVLDQSDVDCLLIRFNNDGTVDYSFNNTGYILTDFDNNNDDFFYSFDQQLDGKIVCAGWTESSNKDSILIRYTNEQLSANQLIKSNFSVSPNPFKDEVNIHFDNTLSHDVVFDIHDINGRKIKTIYKNNFNSNEVKIDLSDIQNGVYFIKIHSENETFTSKIIKL